MKLKNIYPAIVTANPEKVIAFHEKMYGFKVIHKIENNLNMGDCEYVLENPDGFRLDVIQSDVQNDFHTMRVNVDDFDEALAAYQAEGFAVVVGPETNQSFRRALLCRENGTKFMLMQHLK